MLTLDLVLQGSFPGAGQDGQIHYLRHAGPEHVKL